ncbi:MAG: TonB-dependent receptor [Candidatus Marinimicrobia bacterium]|nr:TonB-dependent receptor [Candidatus Neomarinimicrobiota bacterium]
MKFKQSVSGVSILLFVVILSVNLQAAKTGTIKGIVTDQQTGSILPGANCYLSETAIGASADLNGEFRIINVPAGQYTLNIVYIGYSKKEIKIEVEPGRTTNINIGLSTTAISTEEVVVTAQRKGQVSAINQQLTADQMKNVVSAEKIQEVPDANAAESISRLPGISLIRNAGEGSNVVVRGLSPKYNKTTINGITIPSSHSSERQTDLSMVSSENLSGIEVFKAITPDMEGDAIGGTVNLQIAKAKETPNRYLRLFGAYNAQENDPRQYKFSINWSQRILNNKLGIQSAINSEFRNRSSDDLKASYTLGQPREGEPTPLRLTSATVGDTEEYRKRNGVSLILDYDIDKWEFMLSNFYNTTNRDIGHRETEFSGSDMNSNSIISNPERNISLLTNIFNSKGLIKKLEVDVTLSHSYTENNLLHNTTLEFLQDRSQIPMVDFEVVHPTDLLNDIVPDSSSNLRWAEHEEIKVHERNYLGSIDFKLPYKINRNIVGDFKFGTRFRRNTRTKKTVGGDWYVYLGQQTFAISNFFDSDYDPGSFLDGKSSLGLVLDPSLTNTFYDDYSQNFTINDWNGDRYETVDDVLAGYVMTKLNIGQFITFIPGVRYEQFIGNYLGEYKLATGFDAGLIIPKEKEIVYNDWLPMVHLKIKPTDWFDIRMAITKTLVRPDFTSLLPKLSTSLDEPKADISQGNSNLDPTRAINYDFYTSFYNPTFGLFTAGYFYKKLDGVIVSVEQFIDTEEKVASLGLPLTFHDDLGYIGRILTMPLNAEESTVRGIELDLQTNFAYLPHPFKGIVLNCNYTRLWSETPYPFFKVETIIDRSQIPPKIQKVYINEMRKGRVVGQSDHLINVSVGYDIGGLSARLSYTYQGESLSSAGSQDEKDQWDQSFKRWDFSLKQKINKKIDIFLNGVNLNNQSDGSYQGLDSRPTKLHFYGTMYDLGVQYRF